MKLNTNIQALISSNALWHKNNALGKASTNLSLGTKINKSGDDPSGMAISNKMRMQIKGLDIASRNTTDATSLVQVAEGGLIEVSSITQRIRELAVNAANDTLSVNDRELIQIEVNQLVDEIDDISNKIEFNQKPLLNDSYEEFIFQIGGSEGQEIKLALKSIDSIDLGIHTKHTGPNGEVLITHTKVGPNGEELRVTGKGGIPTLDANGNIQYQKTATGEYLTKVNNGGTAKAIDAANVREPDFIKDRNNNLYVKDNTGNYLTVPKTIPPAQPTAITVPQAGVVEGLDLTETQKAVSAIERCDKAIASITEYRSMLGSTQNRLDSNNNSLSIAEENTKLSLSRIMDTDMAEEMSLYTQNNILVQAGIAMLTQANQRPNQLLSLLQ